MFKVFDRHDCIALANNRRGSRITNRCFTDWNPTLYRRDTWRHRPMTLEEVGEVRSRTGSKPFVEVICAKPK